MPATVPVVNVTVATPLPFVVLVAGENDPLLPVLLHVTVLPEVETTLPLVSANCALIVTAVPATGLLSLDVTRYFVAGPATKVTVPPVTATGVTMDSVFTSAVVDCRLQVEMPKALVAEQGPKVLLDPLAETVGFIPGTALLFTSFRVMVRMFVAR